jgi:hypothetical protein
MFLIRIKDHLLLKELDGLKTNWEVLKPFDAVMVSGGVLLVFIIFAGVLAWPIARPEAEGWIDL